MKDDRRRASNCDSASLLSPPYTRLLSGALRTAMTNEPSDGMCLSNNKRTKNTFIAGDEIWSRKRKHSYLITGRVFALFCCESAIYRYLGYTPAHIFIFSFFALSFFVVFSRIGQGWETNEGKRRVY